MTKKMTKTQARKRLEEAFIKVQKVYTNPALLPVNYNILLKLMDDLRKQAVKLK